MKNVELGKMIKLLNSSVAANVKIINNEAIITGLSNGSSLELKVSKSSSTLEGDFDCGHWHNYAVIGSVNGDVAFAYDLTGDEFINVSKLVKKIKHINELAKSKGRKAAYDFLISA